MELLVAGIITAFVLGSISMGVGQLARAKNSAKLRYDAHIRADSALNALRRDIASVTRSDDLFYCRVLLYDDSVRAGDETFDRDELLIFNTRLRPTRNAEFSGQGFEYETQYRVIDDDFGPVLWQRRDAMPDEFPAGGGQATPAVEGVLGLMIQAYDGSAWYDEWDSDLDGLPLALSVAVVTSGHRDGEDVYTAPRAVLRTIISIDRVLPPKDLFKDPDEEESEDGSGEIPEDADGDGVPDVAGGGGGGGGGPIGGGGGGGGPGGPSGPPGGNPPPPGGGRP